MSDSLPRIGIDYTAAISQGAGIGRSVRELVRALVAVEPGIPLELFVARTRDRDLPVPPGQSTYHRAAFSERTLGRLWYGLKLPIPIETWTGPLDLFHAMDFGLPALLTPTKTIVTIHDLAWEHYPDETMPGMLSHLKSVVPRSIEKADHVVAVSEATRQDVIKVYGTPPEKVTVIHHGVSGRFNQMHDKKEDAAVRAKYHLPAGPLILTVGTLQPRKNHLRLVQAFAQMARRQGDPPTLVIAGGEGWSYQPVTDEVHRLRISDRVVFTGRVDEDDLPALYRASTIFAYPSLYEGFGLPILEAMACGVPVLASDTPALSEVVGDAGVLVNPLEVTGMSYALDSILGNDQMRDSLCKQGTARARQFTWTRTAEQTWDLYELALRRPEY